MNLDINAVILLYLVFVVVSTFVGKRVIAVIKERQQAKEKSKTS